MEKTEQDKLYDTTLQMIGTVSKLPIIRVNREEFLRKQFANSPYIDQIVQNGPQSVFTPESLRKKADEVIKSSTNKASLTSFVAGLPGNPIMMVVAGGADVVQYFGFAINMSQQIAYIFGEDELFASNNNEMSEEAKMRVIAYLGCMLGAGGAASLIANVSKAAGAKIGKTVASRALTRTAWYPIMKKVGAILGQKITKKTVEKTIAKAVPVVGGIISGGLTYFTFSPMGNRLADIFLKTLKGEFVEELELNPEFAKTLVQPADETETIIDVDFVELEPQN